MKLFDLGHPNQSLSLPVTEKYSWELKKRKTLLFLQADRIQLQHEDLAGIVTQRLPVGV